MTNKKRGEKLHEIDWLQAGGTMFGLLILPALLWAELGYHLRLHCRCRHPTTNTRNSNISSSPHTRARLSLCMGRHRLGLRLSSTPRFQRGQWGLKGR